MPCVQFEELEYEMLSGESVLKALIRGGADVDFSCRKGACQVCMMRLIDGQVNHEATRRLRPELVDEGHFLPCCAYPTQDVIIDRADTSAVSFEALVTRREMLSRNVVRLCLEPEINLQWRPGQYINLGGPDGLWRSYSIASVAEEDYFLTCHVKRIDGGQMSCWIHDELQEGDFIQIQGPMGDCVYRPSDRKRPLLLLGTGTGLAPLYGVLRDALRREHRPSIEIYHGASCPEDLYLESKLQELTDAHDNLSYIRCISDPEYGDGPWFSGHVTDAAFGADRDLAAHVVYLCGNPDMVYDARYHAIGAGVRRQNILSDPFVSDKPYWPQDNEKLAAIEPDPEMWEALEQGKKLRAILRDLYDQIYDDPRLSPFFHNSTKERAISKQYEFLASIFNEGASYFGLLPFNAHHWMIISDELFDYREDLLEDCIRRHEIPEHLIRRWMSIQELFRREIVKSSERGMIVDGTETLKTGYSRETLAIGSLCDGCQRELPGGTEGIMHRRTGEFYCKSCNPTAT